MKKIITLILLTLLLTNLVSALNIKESEIENNLNKIDLSQTPKTLRFLLGKPKINIELIKEDNTKVIYGFKILKNKVEEFQPNGIKKPNYVISLTEQTLETITASKDPIKEIVNLYKNKEITIQAKTYGTKIKYFFASKFLKR